MDWTQTLTIIGVNAGVLAIFATFLVWLMNKLDADINGISKRMDGHASRIDQLYTNFTQTTKEQNARTDRLYEMFIDLLKECKK